MSSEPTKSVFRGCKNPGADIAMKIIILAALIAALFLFAFQFYKVQDHEMSPYFEEGDLVLVNRLSHDFYQDDVILYESNGELKLGRILAVGGDVVSVGDQGELLVNGTNMNNGISETILSDAAGYPLRISENEIYVCGDNRTQCTDSRDYGTIPVSRVKGRAIFLLRRTNF